MTSPLIDYANAYLLITSEGVPEVVDGRIISNEGVTYIIECYLTREQSTGTSTGGNYIKNNLMPGGSGTSYLYRGYGLRYAITTSGYDLNNGISSGLAWTELKSNIKPIWLVEGIRCKHKQGLEEIKYCKIEKVSGRYGGNKIDEIISNEIGGIPMIIRSGEVID